MAHQWFFGRDGDQHGPFSAEQMRQAARAGAIRPEDLVWRQGSDARVPAVKVHGLFPDRPAQPQIPEEGDECVVAEIVTQSPVQTTATSPLRWLEVICPNCRCNSRLLQEKSSSHAICKICGNTFFSISPETEQKIEPELTLPGFLFQARDLSDQELAVTRQAISNYVRKVPHHTLFSLGNDIQIRSGRLFPIRSVRLHTLYEQRTVKKAAYVLEGLENPIPTIDESGLDPWKTEFEKQTDYQTRICVRQLDESRRIENCGGCQATGTCTCPGCEGMGRATCSQCKGKQSVACPQCSGNGRLRQAHKVPAEKLCGACGGTGRPGAFQRAMNGSDQRCNKCHGRGFYLGHDTHYTYTPCLACGSHGVVGCGVCRSSGMVVCANCGGRATVTCSQCKGGGRVLSVLMVEQSLEPAVHTKQLCDGLTAEAVRHLVDAFGRNDDSIVILEGDINEALAAAANFPSLEGAIRDMAGEAISSAVEGTQIYRQSACIMQTVAAHLQYEYDGVQYEALVVGPRAECLPLRSPLSDVATSMLDSALASWQKHEVATAAGLLRRCNEMAAKSVEVKETLENRKNEIPKMLLASTAVSSTVVSVSAAVSKGATAISSTLTRLFGSTAPKRDGPNGQQ